MNSKFYALGALMNVLTLAVGLMLGFLVGTSYSSRAHAQDTPRPIEEVSPNFTAGAAAFGTLLTGKFAADEVEHAAATRQPDVSS